MYVTVIMYIYIHILKQGVVISTLADARIMISGVQFMSSDE